MRKLLLFLGIFLTCFVLRAEIYDNLLTAAKYAKGDRDYSLARYFNEEALRLIPKDSVAERYIACQRLREINRLDFDYPEAIRYGKETVDLINSLGADFRDLLSEEYLMVANLYSLEGRGEEALPYLKLGRECAEDCQTDREVQLKYHSLAGMVYSHLEKSQEAVKEYGKALEIARKRGNDKELITYLNLFGNALFADGDYEAALKVYREQRDLAARVFGADSRMARWSDYCIANMRAYIGDVEEGLRGYEEVLEWYIGEIRKGLPKVSGLSRAVWLDNMLEILRNATAFSVASGNTDRDFILKAYEGVLLAKGLLLEADIRTEKIIRERGTEEEKRKLKELKELRKQLALMRADSRSEAKDIMNLYAKIKDLDYQLGREVEEYSEDKGLELKNYSEISEALSPGEVVLDFADYAPKGKSRQYVCFEYRKGYKVPKLHFIANGGFIDSLLKFEGENFSRLYSGESGNAMNEEIGKRLKKIIGKAERVYYIPSGIFHLISPEAIGDMKRRIGDSYEFRRLTSAREILNNDVGAGNDIWIFGGLDYDSPVPMEAKERLADKDRRLQPLKGSLEEVRSIAGMSKDVRLFIGDEGTEEAFYNMNAHAPRAIHLSTHGFYYSPMDGKRPESLQGYDRAMWLSGLAMSGANLGWTGIVPSEGLLTAAEIAECNLQGTELAVLASCNSARGEITPEGVYGLQRGLKKAGVKGLILSLWEVSDVATSLFMKRFYQIYLSGRSRREAFQKAREEVRKTYTDPYYWAGFVMVD